MSAASDLQEVPSSTTLDVTSASSEVLVDSSPSIASTSASSSSGTSLDTVMLNKLRNQIEYYFSPSNLRRDKFLKGKIAENPDGLVEISVLLTFNRVKAMTMKVEDLQQAIEASADLEMSSDRKQVKAAHPIPEQDDSDDRTVYIKAPFPSTSTLESLQDFAKAYGKCLRIVMRKHMGGDKLFRGSAFFEFSTIVEANDAHALFKTGKLTFEGRAVEKCELLKAYKNRKRIEMDKKHNRESKKEAKEAKAVAPVIPERVFEKTLTPGVIVRLSQLGPSATMETLTGFLQQVGELKFAEFDPAAKTAYLRWDSATDALKCVETVVANGAEIRVSTGYPAEVGQSGVVVAVAPSASAVVVDGDEKMVEDAIVVTDSSSSSATASAATTTVSNITICTAIVLSGDEEKAYWEKIWERQLARHNHFREQNSNNHRSGGRGGRGGRGGGGRGGHRGGGGGGGRDRGQKRSRDE